LDAKTLILGYSREARQIAEELLEKDGDVIVAIPGTTGDAGLFDDLNTARKTGKLEILPVTGFLSCSGSVGRFSLTFTANDTSVTRTVSSIILADEVERKPNFSLYGVEESSAVVSLSQACEFVEFGSSPAKKDLAGKRIAFITGLAAEGNPVITEDVMRCALKLQQEFGRQTYIFTGNLKVAGNGLEALYRQTKKAGTVFMKFTETIPDIHVNQDGNLTIVYVDEVIRETFKLTPDVTVIDEALNSSTFSRDIADKLEIETGPDGFIQSDNVHRATVLTNKKGVFVAGLSRFAQAPGEREADVGNAALCVQNLYQKPPGEPTGKAQINVTGHCVRCLTCMRVCPYGAISWNSTVAVDPQACEGCGICAAECPRFAITINAPAGLSISGRIPEIKKAAATEGCSPSITAFCCSRSVKGSGDLAACMGYSFPPGLQIVEVPCAGSISLEHLFTAFRKGADGVLVLTCHKGNCHSELGNIYAHQRVDQVSDLLPQLGFEPERLAYKTLASNMGTEFAETVNDFENTILELGPSRLKEA
jgi:coenzyme F420-reducing hydrogenase delta subunit/NAD-dependent dihydropyrimidine dehydrogenase PreA subunit